ncbi:MAG: ribokinase [Ruminococcaceae bacterium]|nr:ribokinase [Oscillospiraceae bacterium]
MREKIVVFGSAFVDLMGRTPHLPVPGQTLKGTSFRQGTGGKGFNQAVAANRAGADVTMMTKLGRDSLAQLPLKMMQELHMPTDGVFYHDEIATGCALILVDETSAQNEIVVIPGACDTINDSDIASVVDRICEAKYLLLQLEINQDANEKVARMAKQAGVRVVINTAPYAPMSDEFLRGAYLVTPNEVEAYEMTDIEVCDEESARKAAEVFFAKGVENVVITMGSRGAYIHDGTHGELIEAYRVKAIDTTGAGDAFNGGLLAALAEGKSLFEAARFANAVAALAVQQIGATANAITRAEIDEFLENH